MRALHFLSFNNSRAGNSKMHLSTPVVFKVVFLLLLIRCWLLLPLWDSVIVLCFVVRYFTYILVLQSSWCGRDSWLLCLVCLPGVSRFCVDLPRGAMGLSAVCDCDISWSYLQFWDGFGESAHFNLAWAFVTEPKPHVLAQMPFLYCKFGNFRENLIFANSFKRHICNVKNRDKGMIYPYL